MSHYQREYRVLHIHKQDSIFNARKSCFNLWTQEWMLTMSYGAFWDRVRSRIHKLDHK